MKALINMGAFLVPKRKSFERFLNDSFAICLSYAYNFFMAMRKRIACGGHCAISSNDFGGIFFTGKHDWRNLL